MLELTQKIINMNKACANLFIKGADYTIIQI